METKTCSNCLETGYRGDKLKGKWYCETCLEYNNINTEVDELLKDDTVECECGNLLTGWDNFCNECGRKKE